MSDDDAIPTSYEQWRHNIEDRGQIRLTSDYVNERLTELRNSDHARTREFVRIYGADHLQQIIAWFHRASDEFPKDSGRIRHA